MKRYRYFALFVALLSSACMISPQKKGTVTTEMRGAALLTEKGDELMQTGVYSQRQVSPQFAQGYEKGLSDAAKRDYWSMQEAQRWAHQ
jgi:hypothetical protein